MPKLNLKNVKNEKVGSISLSDEVFGVEIKEHLLHEIVRMQRSRKRAGTACVKERNAVAGGGAKPYRQKGTGRARQGTIRAPNHVGGGAVFGPRPRSYAFNPPKKVRRGALCSALSLFVKEDRLVVLDAFEMGEIKTREVENIMKKLGLAGALIVDDVENEKLKKSASNLSLHGFLSPEGLNVYDILRHEELVLTKRAARAIEKRLMSSVRERKVAK